MVVSNKNIEYLEEKDMLEPLRFTVFPRNFGDAMLQRLRWSWANLHWWSTTTVLRVYEPVALAFKAFEKKHVL